MLLPELLKVAVYLRIWASRTLEARVKIFIFDFAVNCPFSYIWICQYITLKIYPTLFNANL